MRPFTPEEAALVYAAFSGDQKQRNQLLFIVGYYTGFRISGLLSLRRKNVQIGGYLLKRVRLPRAEVKGKKEGVAKLITSAMAKALSAWLVVLDERGHNTANSFLFQNRYKRNEAIDRGTAYKIINGTARSVGVVGAIGCHSLRKSFGFEYHISSGRDFFQTSEAMGHSDPRTTKAYFSFDEDWDNEIILSMPDILAKGD